MSLVYGLLGSSDNDLREFKEFHNLLFKNTDVSEEWLKWYIRRIASEHRDEFATRIYTLRDDEKLIGTWCVEPKDLILDDCRIIKVGRCFSVGIHLDYRRRNLFVELSKYAIEQERTVWKQYDYVLGYPQIGRPVIDAHLKSGWDTVQTIDMFSYKPTQELEPFTIKHVYQIEDFNNWDPKEVRVGCFDESDRYRNIRWLQHPDCLYSCLGHGKSYIVLKNYASACHVLSLGGTHDEVRTLLNVAKTLAYRHKWKELTIWNAANEYYHEDIVACGFEPGATCGSSVVLLAARINSQEPLEFTQCHFQMGSEEIY